MMLDILIGVGALMKCLAEVIAVMAYGALLLIASPVLAALWGGRHVRTNGREGAPGEGHIVFVALGCLLWFGVIAGIAGTP